MGSMGLLEVLFLRQKIRIDMDKHTDIIQRRQEIIDDDQNHSVSDVFMEFTDDEMVAYLEFSIDECIMNRNYDPCVEFTGRDIVEKIRERLVVLNQLLPKKSFFSILVIHDLRVVLFRRYPALREQMDGMNAGVAASGRDKALITTKMQKRGE